MFCLVKIIQLFYLQVNPPTPLPKNKNSSLTGLLSIVFNNKNIC